MVVLILEHHQLMQVTVVEQVVEMVQLVQMELHTLVVVEEELVEAKTMVKLAEKV